MKDEGVYAVAGESGLRRNARMSGGGAEWDRLQSVRCGGVDDDSWMCGYGRVRSKRLAVRRGVSPEPHLGVSGCTGILYIPECKGQISHSGTSKFYCIDIL